MWCVFHGGTKLVWLHIDDLQTLQMDPFSPTLHGNNICKLWRYNVLKQHLSFFMSYNINSHIVNSWKPWELSIGITGWIVMQNQISSIIWPFQRIILQCPKLFCLHLKNDVMLCWMAWLDNQSHLLIWTMDNNFIETMEMDTKDYNPLHQLWLRLEANQILTLKMHEWFKAC